MGETYQMLLTEMTARAERAESALAKCREAMNAWDVCKNTPCSNWTAQPGNKSFGHYVMCNTCCHRLHDAIFLAETEETK